MTNCNKKCPLLETFRNTGIYSKKCTQNIILSGSFEVALYIICPQFNITFPIVLGDHEIVGICKNWTLQRSKYVGHNSHEGNLDFFCITSSVNIVRKCVLPKIITVTISNAVVCLCICCVLFVVLGNNI